MEPWYKRKNENGRDYPRGRDPDLDDALVRITPHCEHRIGDEADPESTLTASITMVKGRLTFFCSKCKNRVIIDTADMLHALIEWVDHVLTCLLADVVRGREPGAGWTSQDVIEYVAQIQAVTEKLVELRDEFVTGVTLD